MATFNGMDYAIFILLFLSVAIGIARGFVKEVISLIAWVAAFAISTLYAVKFATLFPGTTEQAPGANPIESVSMVAIIVSYLVLFFGVLICGSIVKWLATYIVEGSGLGAANRFFGSIFGFARGCVIVLITLFFLAFTALTTHTLWKDSKLIPLFNPGVKWMNHMAQPYLAEIQAKMKKTTRKLNQEDMSDIIKVKPANTTATPAPTMTAPAMKMPAAPKAAVPSASAPASTSVPAPALAPASTSAPVTTPTPAATPQQSAPQTQ